MEGNRNLLRARSRLGGSFTGSVLGNALVIICSRIVGNSSITGLRKSCRSSGHDFTLSLACVRFFATSGLSGEALIRLRVLPSVGVLVLLKEGPLAIDDFRPRTSL